jgi:intermediate cleaving peptidase 55
MDKSKKILDFVTGNKQGGPKSEFDKLVKDLGSTKRKPLAPEVGKLRGVKSVYEQRIMRAAADVSARAHAKVYLSVDSE